MAKLINEMKSRCTYIVVPIERKERGQLHPSIAELFIAVSVESTGIDSELLKFSKAFKG